MRILLLLLGISGWLIGRSGEIDGLRTRQDVVRFVRKVDAVYKRIPIFREGGADTGAIDNRYFKLDMDGNGRVDLVVNGGYLLVILDFGNGHYRLSNLGEVGAEYHGIDRLLAIDSMGEPKKLVISHRQGMAWNDTQSKPLLLRDTLVARFGSMVEFNPKVRDDFRFDSIKIVTSRCFGTCPVFEMMIDAAGKARYHAIQFNDEEGFFTGKLSAEDMQDLLGLLQYMALDKLDTDYMVNWTDDQTAVLKIGYNEKVKRIRDYGERGTFGLRLLYDWFFRYRKKVSWRRDNV